MFTFFERKFLPIAIIYIISLIFIYLTVLLVKSKSDSITLSIILAFFVVITVSIILFFQKFTSTSLRIKDKDSIRYTMFCHKCGWEWMSHTTDRASPQKCPNCNEKTNLEIIGLRKVRLFKQKKEKDLRKFVS